jgi:hypothetical protein
LLSGGVLSNTVTAPTGANPSATGGPTAINGSAATFMRSDAAPAIQLGSNTQKGIVQVDGTTITATAGVISAAGGGGGLTIGTSPISGGVAGGILYDNGGTLEENSSLLYINGGIDTNAGHGVVITAPGVSTNIFISSTAPSVTTGNNNVAIGSNALHAITTATENMCIGFQAGQALTSGAQNVAIGYQALLSSTTDSANMAIGQGALQACNGGSDNVAVGSQAASSLTTSSTNVFIGSGAGRNVTGGSGSNVLIGGYNIGANLTTGGANVIIGTYSTAINLASASAGNVIFGFWQGPGSSTVVSNAIVFSDGNTNVIRLDYNYTTSSVWTFAAPIAVPGAANPVLTTTSAVTSGAGSGAGTLTNAPSAGNPSKWIPFNDNGTTRYIPAWSPP